MWGLVLIENQLIIFISDMKEKNKIITDNICRFFKDGGVVNDEVRPMTVQLKLVGKLSASKHYILVGPTDLYLGKTNIGSTSTLKY